MKTVWDKRPSADNPRNSEGDFIRLDDGRIMYAYSCYHGKSHLDHSPCDIAVIYSTDEGETWSEPRIIAHAADYGVQNIMSVSVLRQQDGAIGVYYLCKEKSGNTSLARSISYDGEHYTPERCELKACRQYFVINNQRIHRLSNGDIVAPAAAHPRDENDYERFSVCMCFVSKDDGKTFVPTAPRLTIPKLNKWDRGMQEPGVFEHADGTLHFWARTRAGYQYEAYSRDMMESFTMPQTFVSSPTSPLQMVKCPKTGEVFIIYNPIAEKHLGNYDTNTNVFDKQLIDYDPFTWGRTPLVIRKSTDDGRTWGPYTVVEDDKDLGCCYPAAFFTEDGAMLLAYCCSGKVEKTPLAGLRITKVSLSEIN